METKNCQNCKKDFNIEPDDFSFYKKMGVPAPTFCPDCRRVRRLAWMNLLNLYKRECDLCNENFISMYSPDSEYTVYCPKCWWGDKWDWRDYGIDFDETKSFLDQFSSLLKSTPLCGLSINTSTTNGSPYNNHAQDLKNCYLTFLTSYNENSAYGVLVTGNKDVVDCSMVMNCDSCYDCMNIFKSNGCVGTRGNARFNLDCFFCRDCDNCTDCIGCTNLKNKKYCIFNQQYSREEYLQIKESLKINTWSGYKKLEEDSNIFWKTQIPKPAYDDMSVDHTGSYVFDSKNCKECYDVTGVENGKFLLMLYNKPVRDVYDISSWGGNLSSSYEGNNIGENASNLKFTQETGIGSMDIEYSKLVFGSSYVFGGVSVRNGKYVILNKEYSKDQYFELMEKIKIQMNDVPYINSLGHVYKYGEFFPMEISPFAYNKTLAQFFNKLSEKDIKDYGLNFEKDNSNDHSISLDWSDLKDDINEVGEDILKEIISCRECSKGYRIIGQEYSFLKKMNLPIPRECHFCRINKKFNLWVDNMSLKDRVCDKCGINFRTHYTLESAPVIFCKKCYQNEVI
ncbi:MAG: hypothetical protein NTX85_02245 [Candidatus Nomurabacteria bacterium]|nr:hypothetical protein [Candidatus Nomurabacteria bacterium]